MRLSRQLCLATGTAVGALVFALACGGGGSSSSTSGSTPTGTVNLVVTDAPSDQWAHVWVKVTKVTLVKAGGGTEVIAFDASTAGNSQAGKIDLVNLDSVGELLASAQIPEGTYDRLKVSIDPDPAHVTLIAQGGGPVTVSKVIGTDIPVTLTPALTVTQGHGGTVQVDFDLSHPLFVVMLQDGTAILNLRLRHKANPMDMHGMQFRGHAGKVTAVTGSGFALTTLHGANLNLAVGAGTLYRNVDTRAAGTLTEMGTLVSGGNLYALVFSHMDGMGGMTASRVFYSTSATALEKLMAWMREGHVLDVDTTASTLTLNNPATHLPQTVVVDTDTLFTFQGPDTILGTGATGLTQLHRGYKVHVTVKDPAASPLHAASVNIQHAVDEGFVASGDMSTFTLGTTNPRTYGYATGFDWWELGSPALASTDLSAWVGTITQQSQGIPARVATSLAWNTAGTRWDARHGILMPYHLPKASLAAGFDAGTSSVQVSYTDPATTTVVTKTLAIDTSATGTLLAKAVNQSGVYTLQPATTSDLVSGAKAWVRVLPQAGSLKAASVVIIP